MTVSLMYQMPLMHWAVASGGGGEQPSVVGGSVVAVVVVGWLDVVGGDEVGKVEAGRVVGGSVGGAVLIGAARQLSSTYEGVGVNVSQSVKLFSLMSLGW